MHPSKPHLSTSFVPRKGTHASLRVGAVGVFVAAILVGLGVATGRVAESSVEQEPTREREHNNNVEAHLPREVGAMDSDTASSERHTRRTVAAPDILSTSTPIGYEITRGAHASQLTRQPIEHHSVVRRCIVFVEELIDRRGTTFAASAGESARPFAMRGSPLVDEVPAYESGGDAWPIGALRSFDARPVRAVRTVRMVVTAYSPDERSCGASADGITASGYSVQVNGGCLVAADPKILPLGSLVSVPGYDRGAVVPVLDTGGAIKGNRLDVLFPTHEAAMRWGRRTLDITIWEYDDGLPNGFKRVRRAPRSDT
jgi:3D (Asp-Asp-Asp) domain-containing protein